MFSMGWDSTLTHLRFGERFRKHRKWLQSAFMTKAALNSYRPFQRRERFVMLEGLLTDPEAYVRHFHRLVRYNPFFMPVSDSLAQICGRDAHGNNVRTSSH